MMALISVLCVLERNSTDPVALAMTLTYALTVQAVTAQSIRCMMQLESRMVNVQRCLSLLDVPQEKIEGDLPLEVFKARFPTWPDHGHIQFNNVVLRYRPDTEIVLNKLSFEV